jgi:hypothetical protein
MKGMNHLTIRAIYLILAWFIALKSVLLSTSTDKVTLYSSLFLYFLPLLVDYLGFKSYSPKGELVKTIGGWLTLGAVVFTLVGVLGGIPLDIKDGTISGLPLRYIWYGSGIWIILAISDWIISLTPQEVEAQEKIRIMFREMERKSKAETMKKRRNFYQKERGADA